MTREELMLIDYCDGYSLEAVARRHGVGERTVAKLMREAGVIRRQGPGSSEPVGYGVRIAAEQAIARGESIAKVMADHGVSYEWVAHFLGIEDVA